MIKNFCNILWCNKFTQLLYNVLFKILKIPTTLHSVPSIRRWLSVADKLNYIMMCIFWNVNPSLKTLLQVLLLITSNISFFLCIRLIYIDILKCNITSIDNHLNPWSGDVRLVNLITSNFIGLYNTKYKSYCWYCMHRLTGEKITPSHLYHYNNVKFK